MVMPESGEGTTRPDGPAKPAVSTRDYYFGSAWPDRLIEYLNRRYPTRAEWLTFCRRKSRALKKQGVRMDVNAADRWRRAQHHVRNLVNGLLTIKDINRRAGLVNVALDRVRMRAHVSVRKESRLPVGPGGTPFTLQWIAGPPMLAAAPAALLDLARLLDSNLWDSLRQCPACPTYFLAGRYHRKKYCSRQCMWRWLQAHHRRHRTPAAQARAREKARARRHEVVG